MWAQTAQTTVGGLFFVDDDYVAVGITAVLHTVDSELYALPVPRTVGVNTHAGPADLALPADSGIFAA